MKKLTALVASALLTVSLQASSTEAAAEETLDDMPSKTGFLMSRTCVEEGRFADCRLETAFCGHTGCFKDWQPGDKVTGEIVLYVHDDGKAYTLDTSKLHMHELDEGIMRNEVEIVGPMKGDTIVAHKFTPPPPPKKSFFKGCL